MRTYALLHHVPIDPSSIHLIRRADPRLGDYPGRRGEVTSFKKIIMSYLAVKDLKKTRSLRERPLKEQELIHTKDGQPFALLIGIPPENLEKSLVEIRRAMFSTEVMGARQKAVSNPPGQGDIDDEIMKSRRNRGIK